MQYEGILEQWKPNVAQLRQPMLALPARQNDPFVPKNMIRDFKLRDGVLIEGEVDEKGKNGKGPRITKITSICHIDPDDWIEREKFEDQTVVDPQPQIVLEPKDEGVELPYGNLSVRTIDLICPLGFGQRALVVAPPRTGKTVLLQQIGTAVKANYPEIDLIVVLVDERPEEVTEMRRSIPGQVFASCNDREVKSHTRIGRLAIEYAKALAQAGRNVVVLLDSLTRLSRAYNVHQRDSGKTLTGGLDARALEIPKRLFGAARKFETGGSLTMIATALIDTGSRMDDYIFQEYKGTGNMELVLSRELANDRYFPAIDIPASGTRKEELLVGRRLPEYNALRRHVTQLRPKDAYKALTMALGKFPTNSILLNNLTAS